ncbi:hypothetical protein PSTT_11005 [Puccinia striiformis]|uniref:Amino acid permease/ SLC12A domain-containing protein n=1 Tax=Puccinia striiformis TaxID=27350 RepID=A0A2S4V216_9BASI|nr:hypothetical protein PSTT_11005 [Puccinia striiformis]
MTQRYDNPTPLNVSPPPPKHFDDTSSDEKNVGYLPEKVDKGPPTAMARKLNERQLTLMSVGGTIGTGLFLGMGSSLNNGGPMGLLLGYLIMGTVVCSVQMALGEMITFMPSHGALTNFPARFVDPALGFSVGWNYWYSFAICVAGEVTAASIVADYWKAPVSMAVWITIFFLTACAINFFGVKCYGEFECIFAVVKVFAITSLVVIGLVLNLGIGEIRDFLDSLTTYLGRQGVFWLSGQYLFKQRIAFWVRRLWRWQRPRLRIPGRPFRGQSKASSIGEPTYFLLDHSCPAVERFPNRHVSSGHVPTINISLLLFYVASAFVVGIVVPFNEPRLLGGTGDASSSPFVIAINRSKIKILPDIINAVVLVSAYSATSSEVYCGSRVLHGLVMDRMAPQIFGRVNSRGTPINALIVSALPGLLAYMNLSTKSSTVFLWLVNVSAMGGIFTWWSVCLTYIRFHKGLRARGIDRNKFDYKAPFQPYLSYYGLVMLTAIVLMSGFKVFLKGNWSWGTFIGAYITVPIFGSCYLFWKLYHKTEIVRLEEMDFSVAQDHE